MQSDEPELRLNILALPNQQKLIVIMLATVVFGTLVAIAYNAPAFVFISLAMVMFVLSLRHVLVMFEADVRRLKLRAADERYTPLQERIDYLARERLGMREPPLLAIGDGAILRVVATWRRRYIAVGEERADQLLTLLADPQQEDIADVALLHELHHLAHGDHLWIAYARALLDRGPWLILWAALLLIGMVGLLALVQRSFFTQVTPDAIAAIFEGLVPGSGEQMVVAIFGSREAYAEVAAQAGTIDFSQVLFGVIVNTLPYVVICTLLLWIYWRRLLQLREFCADAGAVQVLGQAEPFLRALFIFGTPTPKLAGNGQGRQQLWRALPSVWLTRYLYTTSPGARAKLLRQPDQFDGKPLVYGLTIGLYLLGLNLIMSSTTALMLVGSWPMHFPVITTAALVGLYLLTPIILGRPVDQPLWVALLAALALHALMILISLTILVILGLGWPDLLMALMERTVRSMVWYTRLDPSLVVDDPASLLPLALATNLVQIPIVVLVSAGAIGVIIVLTRRMLTWYGLPRAERQLMRLISLMIGAVTALVAMLILPPITDVALLRLAEPLSLGSPFFWLTATITLALAAVLAWQFVRLDRRYGRRCPRCGAPVSGPFVLGKQCPACGEELHPWLGVRYSFPKLPRPRAPEIER